MIGFCVSVFLIRFWYKDKIINHPPIRHLQLILEIEKETKGARERAKLQREARLQAQARKREKLKQAYIQKRAASLATNNQ